MTFYQLVSFLKPVRCHYGHVFVIVVLLDERIMLYVVVVVFLFPAATKLVTTLSGGKPIVPSLPGVVTGTTLASKIAIAPSRVSMFVLIAFIIIYKRNNWAG